MHKDGSKRMRWKNGSNYPKSVVISDFQIFETDEIFGSAGWAPPEQWLGQIISRLVFLLTTKCRQRLILEVKMIPNISTPKMRSHLVV